MYTPNTPMHTHSHSTLYMYVQYQGLARRFNDLHTMHTPNTLMHTHTHTHSVKVRSTLCGYVVLRRVNDSKNNVLKTVELLFERKWVRFIPAHCMHVQSYMCMCMHMCVYGVHVHVYFCSLIPWLNTERCCPQYATLESWEWGLGMRLPQYATLESWE